MIALVSRLVVVLLSLTVHAAVVFEPGTPTMHAVALIKNNFDLAINDPANPIWLLKFYAPWCGHCKKLAPVLNQISVQLKGKMSIGTIDCTIEKKLCDRYEVRGYPTLKYSIDGEVHEYPGGRKDTDFLNFAEKLNRNAVALFSSVPDVWKALASSDDGVAYVAHHPSTKGATIDEKLQSGLLTQIFGQVARKHRADGTFYLLEADTDVSELGQSGPLLCRLERDVPPRCFENMKDLDLNSVARFVRDNNHPTVSYLGAHNFNKVGRSGRMLVVAVVDTEVPDQLETAKRELKQFAISGPEGVRDKYYYGYFDGKMFQKFLLQFDVSPENLPQLLILDVPGKTYWQNATYRLNVEDFITAVVEGKLKYKIPGKRGFEGVMLRLYYAVVAYRPWSIIISVLFLAVIVLMILSVMWPSTPPLALDPLPPVSHVEAATKPAEEKDEPKDEDESKKDK